MSTPFPTHSDANPTVFPSIFRQFPPIYPPNSTFFQLFFRHCHQKCVILALFGCGYATLLQVVLLPDFAICRTLAQDPGPDSDRLLINIDRRDAEDA
jgi:hypothetical protein